MFKIQCKHVKTEKQKTQTKISFATDEEVDELELIQIEKAPGYLIFSPDNFKQGVEEAMRNVSLGIETGKQSPSKRLRGELYQFWFKHRQDKYQWEDFYKLSMEKLIAKIESQL